jgi:hypothetical protein
MIFFFFFFFFFCIFRNQKKKKSEYQGKQKRVGDYVWMVIEKIKKTIISNKNEKQKINPNFIFFIYLFS